MHFRTYPGAEITRIENVNRITFEDGVLRVYVTTVPEDGKANAAVQNALAKAMGVAKSRLILIKGQSARDKVFRLE